MHIIINHTSMTPIYEQIVSQIRAILYTASETSASAATGLRGQPFRQLGCFPAS